MLMGSHCHFTFLFTAEALLTLYALRSESMLAKLWLQNCCVNLPEPASRLEEDIRPCVHISKGIHKRFMSHFVQTHFFRQRIVANGHVHTDTLWP